MAVSQQVVQQGARSQKKVDTGASIGLLDACLLAARGYPGTSLADWLATFPVALLRRALAQLGALDARDSLRTASAFALGSGHLPDAERRRIIVDAEAFGRPDPSDPRRVAGPAGPKPPDWMLQWVGGAGRGAGAA